MMHPPHDEPSPLPPRHLNGRSRIIHVTLDLYHRLRVGAWEAARRFTPEAHLDRLLPVLEAAARS